MGGASAGLRLRRGFPCENPLCVLDRPPSPERPPGRIDTRVRYGDDNIIGPDIPGEPGFYRDPGDGDWLRTQEGVWLRSTFPFNERWTLNASVVESRPFMLDLEPIGFDWLRQHDAVPGDDSGIYLDDRDAALWLRTIEGVWLLADMEAPEWWTLDLNDMPDISLGHLRHVTLPEAVRRCADYDGAPAIERPFASYAGIAATLGEWTAFSVVRARSSTPPGRGCNGGRFHLRSEDRIASTTTAATGQLPEPIRGEGCHQGYRKGGMARLVKTGPGGRK